MPGRKKKKLASHQRSYASYDLSVMKKAIHAVIVNKFSHKRAAKEYGVPRSSLIRYLNKVKSGDGGIDRNIGRPCILSQQQEDDLSQVIQNMESRLFGLTLTDVRKIVYMYCNKHGIAHNFSETSGMAGRAWMEGFRQRHPELSLRKPEAVSVQRASGFNRAKVDRFFEVLESAIFSKEGKRLIPPENIFNADESGYTIVQKPHKVLAKTGKKNVGQVTSGERGKTITTVCCMSGAGQFVPPLFIFPRKNMSQRLMDNAPPGSIGTCTPTGWINEEKFAMWFNHFIKTVQPQARESPTILIFDGHASHVRNIELIDKAREHNVLLLCLPSHCTHKLQPMDVSFFKSMNWQYDDEIRIWMREHDGRRVTEYDVAGIFAKAYAKAATVKNAISGFEKCGIHPFRKDMFSDEDFLGADFTDNPLCSETTSGSATQEIATSTHSCLAADQLPERMQESPDLSTSMEPASSTSTNDDTTGVVLVTVPATRSEDIETRAVFSSSASQEIATSTHISVTADELPECVQESPDLSTSMEPASSTSTNDDTPGVVLVTDPATRSEDIETQSNMPPRFSDVIQVPKQLRQPSLKRKRKVAHAEIITSSPYKNELKKRKSLNESTKTSRTKETVSKNEEQQSKKKRIGESTTKKTRITRPKTQKMKSKKHITANDDDDDNTLCLYCKGAYRESVEGWIQCTGQCKLWAHNSCAGVDSQGPTDYVCELCGDVD